MGAEHSARRQFLTVVGWEDFQYSELHKKPDPPWKWCRLPRTLMDDPEFQRLSQAQRGALMGLLMLASETGNLIPDEPRYLRSRIQIDARLRLSLIDVGWIEQIALPADSPEIKKLRKIYAGRRPDNVHTRGRGRGRREKENIPSTTSANPDTAEQPDQKGATRDDSGPLPPHPDVNALVNDVAKQKTTSGQKWRRNGNGQDPRDFEEINAAVLDLVLKLETNDPERIFQLGGQGRQLSLQQCRVAVRQLRDRGQV